MRPSSISVPAVSFACVALAFAPAGAAEKVAPEDMEKAIGRILERQGQPGWQAGIVILDDAGKTRASIGGERPLTPASNQKVLVVGAGLGLLGVDHRFETTLSTQEPPKAGAIRDLLVRSNGDPNISKRFHDDDPTALFRAWAGELKRKGVAKVRGDIVVDDSCFDAVRFLPGWKADQAGRWYAAEVSAVNLNDNCVDVIVVPGRPGQAPKVEFKPATTYFTVQNECRTVEGRGIKPVIHRPPGTNTIVVKGQVATGYKPFISPDVSVSDPPLYFGTVLGDVLRAEGIGVDGKVVRGKLSERAGASPLLLVQHRSSLLEDLPVINKRSQNLHAEILLKSIGARAGGEGSAAGGVRAVTAFLAKEGIPAAGLRMEDGSGFSPGNRVSAATLAGVLGWVQKQPFFGKYLGSLPIAGKDGTLEKRFKAARSAGHVFAKTGYIAGVSALSGYVEKGGRHWVFSVLLNGVKRGKSLLRARALEEDVAETIYLSMPD